MATIVTRAGKGSPLTNNEVDANFVNLNTELVGKVATVASADGSVAVTGTTAIDLAVVKAPAAMSVVVTVRNSTGATLTKGTVVYITGATGQTSTVSKAIATSDSTSAQTLGLIAADIPNNTTGSVILVGGLDDVDTSAYADGQQLYLSPTTAGGMTSTKPYAPNHLVYTAVVEYAHAVHGKLFVKVQNGYELDELHDVAAQTPTNGQTIVYNSTSGLWEKNTVSLTAGVNGTLAVTKGGTGATTLTGYIKGNSVYAFTASSTIPASDISSGAALSKTDDTNVTLTLGGSPTTSLLAATSLTLGWTGQLSVARGGTGAATLTGIVVGNGTSAFTTVTAPSGAVVGTTDTQTLTNKRVTPRMNSQSSTTSPWAWNSDSYDIQAFTALANALTINADAGTPTDGQRTVLRFKDDGTARTLTWTTGATNAFRAIGVTLPTTTVVGKTVYVGCLYNAFDSRWDAVAVSQEA